MPSGKLRKRKNIWYLDIHTGRKKNGGYERIQRRARGDTKAEARAELDEHLYKLRRAHRIGMALDNEYPVEAIVDQWVEHITRTTADPKTRAEYIHHCRRFAQHLNCEIASDITHEKAEHAMDRIKNDLSTNTANKGLAKFKAALEYARIRGKIRDNPIATVKTLREVRKKHRRAMTPKEVDALLKHSPEPWRTIYHTFLATGIRRNELIALKWADIDLHKKTLCVRETAEFRPKTQAGTRTIPLGKTIATALRALPKNTEYVFTAPTKKKPLGREWCLQMFKRHMSEAMGKIKKNSPEKTDISGLDLHAMRYTFVTEMIAAGTDPKTVQYLAGHKSIQTTLAIYAQVRGGNTKSAINALPWS